MTAEDWVEREALLRGFPAARAWVERLTGDAPASP